MLVPWLSIVETKLWKLVQEEFIKTPGFSEIKKCYDGIEEKNKFLSVVV